MITSVIFSGFGGQGLLFAGRVLAQAALDEGRHVTWLPSYGPEMRGGSASCIVVISDHPIGSPIVDVADVLVALNPPALAKYEGLVAPDGLVIVNSSLVEADPRATADVLRVPCSALARDSGDDRGVSIVAMGALVARRPIVAVESIRGALRSILGSAPAESIAGNLRALDAGLTASRATAASHVPRPASAPDRASIRA